MMVAAFLFFVISDNSYLLQTIGGIKSFVMCFICYFLFIFMCLAFGYLTNDFSDIETDKLAGKDKIISKISKKYVYISLLLLFLCGNLPILLLTNFNILMILLIIIVYFMGAAYSIKLFRFKEKGVMGLIISSVAQKCLPLISIPLIININPLTFLLWFLLMFINGLRYIIIHQICDLENDRKTGITTFVSSFVSSKGTSYKKYIFLLIVFEIALVLLILLPHLNLYLTALSTFIFMYTCWEIFTIYVVNKFMQMSCFTTFYMVPLEDLYNIYLPQFFGIIMCLQNPLFLILVIVIFFYTLQNFKSKMSFIVKFSKIKILKQE